MSLRFDPGILACGLRRATPAVEHLGQVCDTLGFFGQPQQEVIILRAIKRRSGTPHTVEQRLPNDQ